MADEKFIVRLYDGFDHEWMDVTGPVSKEEAERVWNENTNNGKIKTSFADIDYYRIFPADTAMLHTAENHERWAQEDAANEPKPPEVKFSWIHQSRVVWTCGACKGTWSVVNRQPVGGGALGQACASCPHCAAKCTSIELGP